MITQLGKILFGQQILILEKDINLVIILFHITLLRLMLFDKELSNKKGSIYHSKMY